MYVLCNHHYQEVTWILNATMVINHKYLHENCSNIYKHHDWLATLESGINSSVIFLIGAS